MPISEATRGVGKPLAKDSCRETTTTNNCTNVALFLSVTTLVALGLSKEINARDLSAIRRFYSAFRDEGLVGAERFSRMVHSMSGVRHNIMTNIPFDSNEAQYWHPKRNAYPEQYRSALRVDPLLSGNREQVRTALTTTGYEMTLESARQYLRDWCDIMKPEYMMASTPHNFEFPIENRRRSASNTGINTEAMKQVGAFADVALSEGCDSFDDEVASLIDENSDLLSDVLMKVCQERDLPVALKIGAHRGLNPRLRQAGDGVVAFADAGMLTRLCTRFPKVRFLATFLSRTNQHEACVLASKFSNLHI